MIFKQFNKKSRVEMKPILYYDEISPPVRSVLLLIRALEIDVDLKYVNLFERGHLDEEFIKVSFKAKKKTYLQQQNFQINPLHTVPALKHDELILTDSHSILIYLSEFFDGENNVFYSRDLKIKSKIQNRLFFNSSLFFKRDSDAMVRDC